MCDNRARVGQSVAKTGGEGGEEAARTAPCRWICQQHPLAGESEHRFRSYSCCHYLLSPVCLMRKETQEYKVYSYYQPPIPHLHSSDCLCKLM